MSDRQEDKKKSTPPTFSGDKPRIMSLSDLKKENDNSMYAGGEKSGMAIQGRDNEQSRLIRGILERAQKGSTHDHLESSSDDDEGTSKSKVFKGKAQKLTSEETGDSNVSSVSTGLEKDNDAKSKKSTQVTRTLTFWRNGFTIAEGGPLYPYEDPSNQLLLKMLQEGQAPLELFNIRPGQAVDVRVAHRLSEDFIQTSEQSRPNQPFTGTGRRLGDMATYPNSSSSGDQVSSGSSKAESSCRPQREPDYDPSRPTTSLQLRFAGGIRMNARFNITATVADIYRYMSGDGTRPFILLYGRPPVQLQPDDGRSLEEAGLLNTVIMQQWK